MSWDELGWTGHEFQVRAQPDLFPNEVRSEKKAAAIGHPVDHTKNDGKSPFLMG